MMGGGGRRLPLQRGCGERPDLLVLVVPRGPHRRPPGAEGRAAPIVGRLKYVLYRQPGRCRGRGEAGPGSRSPRHEGVCALHLPAIEAPLARQVQPDQGERRPDWPGRRAHMLGGIGIHGQLVNEIRARISKCGGSEGRIQGAAGTRGVITLIRRSTLIRQQKSTAWAGDHRVSHNFSTVVRASPRSRCSGACRTRHGGLSGRRGR
jgi:hypothetical protein